MSVCKIYSRTKKSIKTQKSPNSHIETNNPRNQSIPCNDCGKIKANHECLRKHMIRVHKKKLKWICEHCDKIFHSYPGLLMHREKMHMQGIVSLCQLCGKEFLGENLLRYHITRSHSQKKQITPGDDSIEADSSSGLGDKVGFNQCCRSRSGPCC